MFPDVILAPSDRGPVKGPGSESRAVIVDSEA